VISNVGPERDLSSGEQGHLTPADTLRLVDASDTGRADAIVISCTDLRAAEIIPAIETDAGKPAVTSNQALMWAALGVIGVEVGRIRTLGQLRDCPPPPASAWNSGDTSVALAVDRHTGP
jgi:maleate cis-trans isomerase